MAWTDGTNREQQHKVVSNVSTCSQDRGRKGTDRNPPGNLNGTSCTTHWKWDYQQLCNISRMGCDRIAPLMQYALHQWPSLSQQCYSVTHPLPPTLPPTHPSTNPFNETCTSSN